MAQRPEAACMARAITRAVLADWRVGQETADSVLVVVSELVSNAVEHAEPPVALHLHRERVGQRACVGVTDGGPAESHGTWTTSCEHGRGLTIVDALALNHGTRTPSGGFTHWVRMPSREAVA
ncbi:ATP-binding protein [Streptomyces sp. NPDC059718]